AAQTSPVDLPDVRIRVDRFGDRLGIYRSVGGIHQRVWGFNWSNRPDYYPGKHHGGAARKEQCRLGIGKNDLALPWQENPSPKYDVYGLCCGNTGFLRFG